ncbi:MAG: MFS transporter [Bacteroidota bacterium]|nr:MFS transporter [Bacteroidota bacterium]
MYQKIWNKSFTKLTISNFLICVVYYSLISALPVYLDTQLHAGKSIVGIVLAAYTIASVTIRPFSGYALDKFGRKVIFLSALFFYSLVCTGYLFAVSVGILILLRFAHGFAWGVTTISGNTVVVDITPVDKRGEGIGYYGLSTTMGMAIGPFVGMLVARQWGFMLMFFCCFIISTIGFLLAASVKYPKYVPKNENKKFSWSNLFEKKSLIPSSNLFLVMIPYGGLLSFIVLYGQEIGVAHPASFFLVYALGIACSRFLSGKVFDKQGPHNILLICISLLIAGFILLASIKSSLGFYCAALVMGFGNGVVFPIFQAMVNNMVVPNRRGAGNSTLFTFLDLGMGLGMLVDGFISEHLSIRTAFLISSLICTVGLVYFLTVVCSHYNKYKLVG